MENISLIEVFWCILFLNNLLVFIYNYNLYPCTMLVIIMWKNKNKKKEKESKSVLHLCFVGLIYIISSIDQQLNLMD